MKLFYPAFLALIFIALCQDGYSQSHICGDQLLKTSAELAHPGFAKLVDQTFAKAKKNINTKSQNQLTIPVVVHVIYNDDEQNISDALVQEQIDILNEHFDLDNPTFDNVRSEFQSVAGNPEIRFELAQLDPDGSPSTGITRTETDKTTFIDIDIFALINALNECGSDINDPDVAACVAEAAGGDGLDLDQMKSGETGGIDPWDTDKYLNIWVCNLGIDLAGMTAPFILGFAYPPVEAPNWPADAVPANVDAVDGVVITFQAWAKNNPANSALAGVADSGLTCVHEVGHYLGLRHIWGDGDCTMDDGLEDTPSAASNSQPMEQPFPTCEELHLKNSCDQDSLPDMVENYMDYSREECQNMFTANQVGIMRAMLEGPRGGLVDGQISSTAEINPTWFSMAPNPVQDVLLLSTEQTEYSVQIIDINGRVIKQGENINRVSTSELLSGIYFIKLTTKAGQGIRKLIKT